MTLCIGQLHLIVIYGVVFGCVRFCGVECYYMLFLSYSLTECLSSWWLRLVLRFSGILFNLNYISRLSQTMFPNWFSKCVLPACFCTWTYALNIGSNMLLLESCYGMFSFSTSIFYVGIPGLAPDYPCGAWCRGLTICSPGCWSL